MMYTRNERSFRHTTETLRASASDRCDRIIAQSESQSATQDLMFVVRDWQYANEHDFGLEGGQRYIEAKLVTLVFSCFEASKH